MKSPALPVSANEPKEKTWPQSRLLLVRDAPDRCSAKPYLF